LAEGFAFDRKEYKRRSNATLRKKVKLAFPSGLKINAGEYIKVLEEVVKPWMDEIAGGRPHIFQEDDAPAHNAKITQDWCAAILPAFFDKDIWPSSSFDCNPLVYFVWSAVEWDTNAEPHNNAASLNAKITEVMMNMDREILAKDCRRFCHRLEAVVAANGDFIE